MNKDSLMLGFTNRRNASDFADTNFVNDIPFDRVATFFEVEADFADVYTDYGGEMKKDNDRRAVVNADDGHVWNIVTGRYAIHQYTDVLLQSTANLLSVASDDLVISAAGLADYGGVGFVQVQLPVSSFMEEDSVRPTLTIATSHTGRFATQYKLGLDRLWCTNQLGLIHRTKSDKYTFRHTINSHMNMSLARQTLKIMLDSGEAMAGEVERLMNTSVRDDQFRQIMSVLVPPPEGADGEEPRQSVISRWESKCDALRNIYNHDLRVRAEWHGTAWGVYQTFSTYRLWESTLRGEETDTGRFNRNMMSYIGGTTDDFDRRVVDVINRCVAA